MSGASRRLGELAGVFRSKNAGPFCLTVDIVLGDAETFRAVRASGRLNAQVVAERYGVEAGQVQIHWVEAIRTVKVTLPRPGASSGAPGDSDVYGAQQHGPLTDIEIPGMER